MCNLAATTSSAKKRDATLSPCHGVDFWGLFLIFFSLFVLHRFWVSRRAREPPGDAHLFFWGGFFGACVCVCAFSDRRPGTAKKKTIRFFHFFFGRTTRVVEAYRRRLCFVFGFFFRFRELIDLQKFPSAASVDEIVGIYLFFLVHFQSNFWKSKSHPPPPRPGPRRRR